MRRLLPHALVAVAAILIAAILPAPERPASADIAREAGLRVLGAARGYATTALWLRAGDAYRRGDYYETLAAYQLIAELQPRNPAVYSYLSWNQGYNISAPFPEYEQRLEWVVRGLNTLYTGQDRMPLDASLRMDEWHYLLNRGIGYPLGLLEAMLPRYREADARWALAVETLLERAAALPEGKAHYLDEFLFEVGLQFGLIDLAARVSMLPADEQQRVLAGESGELHDYERFQAASWLALDAELQAILILANWCRWHGMTLVLSGALELAPRPAALEIALLNTYRQAWLGVPSELAPEFASSYRTGVESAVRAGIENARRWEGERGAAAFLDHARENLSDVPELLAGLDE
jgi:hypothetical protein